MNRRNFLASSPVLATGLVFPSLISNTYAQTGNTADVLTIGCTAAMTGPLGSFGQNMKLGVDAGFHQINARGGVEGRPLRFSVLDDAYIPARSVENVKKLIGDSGVIALMGCLGTPNNAAISPIIEAEGTPHLGPLTGASSLRKIELRNVFHVRASYTDEINRLVQNLVSMGIRDLAMVYLDNPYGKEVAQDATRALTASGVKAVAMVPLATDGKNLDSVVAAVLAAKPSAVLLGTAGAATTGLVAKLKQASSMMPIAGVSASLTQAGVKELGGKAQGIAITMVFPDAYQAKHLVIRDYQSAMRAIDQPLFDPGSLEGYINARIMAEALTHAGRGVTRAKLRQSLSALRNFDLGGFTVDYGSANARVGSKYVALGILSADGKLKG
ncbi:ABC transporter substrate-binding protein [Rhodoferax sp. UBA5149]|uniref:ABC transporter substrate-binding protein n=1 Tax=Rhodoferax sp. UBA5149 TaxID=1947379 RepID=UPI0025F6E833|nr:ABC transporter substrate-binding protein [Rhodoferax sp. UBA5149]